ncbi:MAG: class I adenylate-forming enzyme family protein [Alphaproteobacteria bacterium]
MVDVARRSPDAPALVLDARTVTFAELVNMIDGMAASMLDHGVTPSTPVGLLLADTPRHLVALLALFRLGVPVLPLGRDDPAERIRGLCRRVGARRCLAHSADRPDVDEIAHVAIDGLGGGGERRRLPSMPTSETVAYYARSSGTTGGIAKLVAITFATMAARDARVVRRLPYGPGERYLRLTSLSRSHGRYHARIALVYGAAVVFPSDVRTPAAMHRAVVAHGATISALTPPTVRDLLRADAPTPLFPGMRLLVGTAALSVEERCAAMERLTPLLHIGYATSEIGGISMATPEDLAADIETVGRPFHDIEAQAVDDDHRPLPSGTIGVLRFRGPETATRYFDDITGATSRFRQGWFYPGDAGMVDAAGRITLKGRADDLINVGGLKVHPGDIEQLLSAHPAVAEAAALAIAAPREGEIPVAAVVPRTPIDEASLLAHCAGALSPRIRPRRILLLDALPRNPDGKIDRPVLIRLFTGAG